MGLTPAQDRVYRFVQTYLAVNGFAPSYEEIGRALGIASKNAVFKHVRALESKGYLTRDTGRSRVLTPVEVQPARFAIPLLGVVAAGIPIEAVEVPESIEVPESFLGRGESFALRVRGNSMIDEGIRDGDVIVIAKQVQVENGRTVVAMIEGEATVKKFYRTGDTVELRPANRHMSPLRVPAGQVEILGVVTGLLRCYFGRPL